MKKKKGFLETACLSILWLLVLAISSVNAKVPDSVLNQKKAVVTIYINDKDGNRITAGSGFIIDSKGIIATNYHVISKWLEALENTVLIKMENGAYFPVEELLAFDEDNDIAIFKIEGKELPSVKLATDYKSKQGEGIIVIGSPLGLETTVSDGIVSNIREKGGLIQITAPVSRGSSGSPVFNSKGGVIGVATFIIEGGQNLNFAIPIKHIVNLLNEYNRPNKKERFILLPEQPASSEEKKYLRKINPEVQLKDNGWLKIVDEFLVEKTPEEFYDEIYSGSPEYRNSETTKKVIELDNKIGKTYKRIYVQIQFLKPCKATQLMLMVDKPESTDELSGTFVDTDYLMPKFRCDYRVKVFVTFFSKDGNEIKTNGSRPPALLINSFSKNRKTEMLPGEKTYDTFILPDEAAYWYVWVPK